MTRSRPEQMDLLCQIAAGDSNCCTAEGLWAIEMMWDQQHKDVPSPTTSIRSQQVPRMFIAMNRFRVAKGQETDFEAVWLNRKVHVSKEPGFVEFHLLRGPTYDDHTLFVSHTIWESEADFSAWTKSQAFHEAHKGAGKNKDLYLGGPSFEGFSVVQRVQR